MAYAGGHLAACHHPRNVGAEEVAGATRSDASPLAAGSERPDVGQSFSIS
jgi:peptide/nickel transport system ATP-binding protein/oligopeptide transport system ATP-binding protein